MYVSVIYKLYLPSLFLLVSYCSDVRSFSSKIILDAICYYQRSSIILWLLYRRSIFNMKLTFNINIHLPLYRILVKMYVFIQICMSIYLGRRTFIICYTGGMDILIKIANIHLFKHCQKNSCSYIYVIRTYLLFIY